MIIEILFWVIAESTSYSTEHKVGKKIRDNRVKEEKKVEKREFLYKHRQRIELQSILLTYMMMEDDGEISASEKRIIKDNYINNRRFIDKKLIKRIKYLLESPITLGGIVKYIELEEVPKSEVDKGLKLLELVNHETERYSGIIDELRFTLSNDGELYT